MLSTTTVKALSHQLVSIYSYPTIGTIGARKTVNDKESAWRKIEKAAIRCIDTRWSITKLMHTPSVYTAVRRVFFIFIRPEFLLHLQLCCAERGVLSDNNSLKHTLAKSARAVLSSNSYA